MLIEHFFLRPTMECVLQSSTSYNRESTVEDEITELLQLLRDQEEQQIQVKMQERQECRSFTSSQIKRVWDDTKDMEMLQARVEKVATEEIKYEKVKDLIDQKLETILKEFTKEEFQIRVEIVVPKVLYCHYENIEMEKRTNAVGHDDQNLIDLVDLSIWLFILRRKRKQLKKKAEEDKKAFSKPIESRSQTPEELKTAVHVQTKLISDQRNQIENASKETLTRSPRSLNSRASNTKSESIAPSTQQQTDEIAIHIQDHQIHHQKKDEPQCELKTLIRFLFISGTAGFLLTVGFLTYIWLS